MRIGASTALVEALRDARRLGRQGNAILNEGSSQVMALRSRCRSSQNLPAAVQNPAVGTARRRWWQRQHRQRQQQGCWLPPLQAERLVERSLQEHPKHLSQALAAWAALRVLT